MLVALIHAGCAGHGRHRAGHGGKSRHMGFASDTQVTQMVTTQVGGKNVYIPSTVVVAAGSGHVLSIYNTTDGPHGFTIPGLDVEVVLLPGQETRVELPELSGHRVYGIGCQLHPPHRTATLVVVPSGGS